MKTITSSVFLTVVTLAAATTLVAGCGKHQKAPSKDLESLRTKALKSQQKGSEKPQTVEKEIIVTTEKVVIQEQATVTENSFVIMAPRKVDFIEGQKRSFTVQPRAVVKGITFELKAANLPENSEFALTDKENHIYTITWTAPYNTVQHGKYYFENKVKFYVEIKSVADEKLKYQVAGLVRETEVDLQVFTPQEAPSNLKVDLPSELDEETTTQFTVTARVPGTNENSTKPTLIIDYDGVSRVASSDVLEVNGNHHIMPDYQSKAEYIPSEDVWKFTPTFDTKNIPVRPVVSINGQLVKNAAYSKMRLTFRIVSPRGTSSAEVLKQVKINLIRAPDAPKFDMSNLEQPKLHVTPGETTKFAFTVYTINQKATLNLDLQDIKELPGSPTITCKSTAQVPSRKDCILTWAVPCKTTDFSLEEKIKMTATATVGNKTSEVVPYELKTSRSNKPAAQACTPKPTQQSKTQEPNPVTPPPKQDTPPSEEGAK
ncbi:MAG: hypothetical protein AB7H97_15420 [Pseudobdellovibrionaceae bacterium]